MQEYNSVKSGYRHYLWLEENGKPEAWAVPRCMPEWPKVKRRCVPLEEDDLRYMNFEGVIPLGQNDAGTIRIWDRGKYEIKARDDHKIEFILKGKKLRGEYIIRWMDKMSSWLMWKRGNGKEARV